MQYTLGIALLSCVASKSIDLTDANFESKMETYDLSLVKFYAPWCGHCKAMAADFDKAADALINNDPPIHLVSVDCTVEKEACQKHGVSGYPTLKIFRNGQNPQDYNEARSYDAMVKTLTGMAGPASVEVDAAKLDKILDGEEPAVVGFFEDPKANGVANFNKVAEELRGKVKFAHSFSAELAEKHGQAAGKIVLFRPKKLKSKFEDQVVVYDKEKMTVGLLRSFAKDNVDGLCPVKLPADQDSLGHPHAIVFYNLDYERDPKGTQYWRNRVMKVAQKFSGIKVAVGSWITWGGVVNELGMSKDDGPVVAAWGSKDDKFVMKEKFSMDTFEAFLKAFEAGELAPHMKTENIPDSENEGKGVFTLTAENFRRLAPDDKDRFIEFYAPWCGHCKSLQPKWDAMGEHFKEDEDVVVGKFDATANDVPSEFEVSGFPTIYWVPANQIEPVKYQGGRTEEDLIKYVNDHKTQKKDEL